MQQQKLKILFTEKEVQRRIQQIAHQLNRQFKGKEAIAIGVLKGATSFFVDLIRQLHFPLRCDFCATASYGIRKIPSKKIQLKIDTSLDIKNQHILLIEDIIDRGLTLQFLQQLFKSRGVQSLTTIALVAKPQSIVPKSAMDYVGFYVKKEDFIVGYGMDYQEKFRNLAYLAKIKL